MKKIFALIIALLTLISLPQAVLAYEMPDASRTGLLIAPAPKDELVVAMAEGKVPKKFIKSLDDLLSLVSIIDESENKILSRKLEHFFDFIPEYYYDEITKKDLFDALMASDVEIDINDMDPVYTLLFDTLDPFSYYLPPKDAETFFSPTASRGIGVKMKWGGASGEEGIFITEVADSSSASEVGIRAGDRLVAFDGYDVSGLALQGLSPLISAIPAERETLSVTVEREEEGEKVRHTFTLERRVSLFNEFEYELYEKEKLFILTINSFMYESTSQKISSLIDVLHALGYRNVIIDLTANSGGDVFVAAEILSKFTTLLGRPLFFMGRDGNNYALPFVSLGNGYDFDSVKVLVDETTASSAEIFAYTLQEMVGASVIGTLTYGKGVAQVTSRFIDDSACGITTYVAYNAKGETYNGYGVTPDERVFGVYEKNSLPKGTPCLTYFNFNKAVFGSENKEVLGLEKRLEALLYLAPSAADGVFDETTALALTALQKHLGLEETGELDESTYFSIMNMIKAFENTFSQTFSSRDYALRKYGIFSRN